MAQLVDACITVTEVQGLMEYTVVLTLEDGTWVAQVPALEWAATEGDSVDEALEMARELIEVRLETMRAHGMEIPDVTAPEIEIHRVQVNA